MKNWLLLSSADCTKSALAILLAVFFAIVAAGGTYALWSDSSTVPGATISSGSATLTATNPAGLTSTALYPGDFVTDEFTVQNTGSVALALRVDALTWPSATGDPEQQAFAEAVTVSVWPKTGVTCSSAPPASAWTAVSSSNLLGVQLARGSVQQLCVTTALALDAPNTAQGGSLDFHLTLGGVQA